MSSSFFSLINDDSDENSAVGLRLNIGEFQVNIYSHENSVKRHLVDLIVFRDTDAVVRDNDNDEYFRYEVEVGEVIDILAFIKGGGCSINLLHEKFPE